MTDKDKAFGAANDRVSWGPDSASFNLGWDAHAELVKPLIEAAKADPWVGVLAFIKKDPDAWLLSFRGADRYELEHFPEYYMGDKEAGTGDWSRSGTMEEILDALTNREGEK